MTYRRLILLLIILSSTSAIGQIKLIVEDFEGMYEGQKDLKKSGIFSFGSAFPVIIKQFTTQNGYSGNRAIKIGWNGKNIFGGWGKGLSKFIDLKVEEDFLNFYVYNPLVNKSSNISIFLEEDDDKDNLFNKHNDDLWRYDLTISSKDDWQLIHIPLKDFKDDNNGGDGIFNIGYKDGKLLTFIISFTDSTAIKKNQSWHFDFICFSKGELPTGQNLFAPPASLPEDYCLLGAWSEEGNKGYFNEIPQTIETLFASSDKKLAVVHFFQPFSTGKDNEHFPSVEHINGVINNGYIPMITLENHYVQVNKNYKQPNLYSIVEGHFDYLFYEWADRIKQVNGTVILRILHEFNGNWYPWCISKNDFDAELYIRAFRHIREIFIRENVNNVKFIWCPNSMSIPQESWNNIMDAYPGDSYVDFVGLDIYNGAGEKGTPVWRSFRKEAIEHYYVLSELLPHKPLLLCEVASREREPGESGIMDDKAEWIKQMSEALTTDLSKVRLLTWFNEYESFKINSSINSKRAFDKYIWRNDFFKTGNLESIQQWTEIKSNQ
ncbi:MAG: glycoside hydrolase family 26 protein [Bacteroidota bacterium]|nr:glycoside hydrolase family 26 protein [Bacteroidota bacterium]